VRRARLWLLALLVILAAGVTALWVAPRMLDWNRHRATIEALASATLGRPVRIEGKISLQVLPEPALTADAVRVADAGDGVSIAARQLLLRVALGPLLTGRLNPRDLELLAPRIAIPWPPVRDARAVQPPDWLTELNARITDGRVTIGEAEFTQVNATLATRGGLVLDGNAAWRGKPLRFTTTLSRAGFDGVAALEARAELLGASFTYTGALAADGSLEGRFAATGEDIARLIPAPPAPFRAQGRLTGGGGLLAADELEIDVGGARAQGAVALRVAPTPRLDIALAAGRIDLAAWARALFGEDAPALPTGLDLSAEATELAGGQLRRVRLTLDLGPDGTTVREASAILPGDAALRLSGRVPRSAQPRFEGNGTLEAGSLRTTLAWLGWTPEWLPARALRHTQFAARITADMDGVALAGIDGQIDDNAVTGNASIRIGTRPTAELGLNFDRLALDPWIARLPDPRTVAGATALTLHLAAKEVEVAGITLQDGALDAGIDGPRIQLRRLEAGYGGGRVAISGALGEDGRISDGLLDLSLPEADSLTALLPPDVRGRTGNMLRGPLAVRMQASGPRDAIAARLTAQLADLRIEAQPGIDLTASRVTGPLTLRHPGAPRLLERFGVGDAPAWLGDGSLALIAQIAATPRQIATENFDLTAGMLRARGALVLDLGDRPKLGGRVTAETLPLPFPYPRDPAPLPLARLGDIDADVALTADHVLAGLSEILTQLDTHVRLQGGVLQLAPTTARLAEGTLSGQLILDATAQPPTLKSTGSVTDAVISGAMVEDAPDLSAGKVTAEWDVTAAGFSTLAALSSLSGKAQVTVRDGMLAAFGLHDLRAALALPDRTTAETAVAAALTDGTTPFGRLSATVRLGSGLAAIDDGVIAADDGEIRVSGSIDLGRGRSDLGFTIRPNLPGAPAIGLTLSGAPGEMRRETDLAAALRWLAER